MRNVASHLAAWLLCAAIGLLVGEIAGTIIFYRQQGALVYFNRRTPAPIVDAELPPEVGQRLHPYLGFGGYNASRSGNQAINNLGFAQSTDYKVPFTPTASELTVFVFGGSVAANIIAPPQGGLSLEAALRQRIKDKKVIVYSMAQGSGKQPQQLIALAMLLAMGQHVDIVVNVDGFNDVAIGYSNHYHRVHPIFPSAAIMWGIGNTLDAGRRTSDFFRTGADLLDARLAITRNSEAANASRYGLAYLYRKAAISFYLRQKAAAEKRYVRAFNDNDNLERIKTLMGIDLPVNEKDDGAEMAFDIWLKSDEAMAALSKSTGARYVHVIQPNQYFSKKKFSEAEAKIALSAPSNDPVRIGAERGYAMFEKQADTIAKRGIVSGVAMFDDQSEAMYVDNCCHYSKTGENILAGFVADQVVKALSNASRD